MQGMYRGSCVVEGQLKWTAENRNDNSAGWNYCGKALSAKYACDRKIPPSKSANSRGSGVAVMVTEKRIVSSVACSTTVLRVEQLAKVYKMGQVEVHALRSVDLEMYQGEFVVILGPSGSGKSTLLNILGGLDVPTTGRIHFFDHDLTSANDTELTRFRREHIGFVFQFYNLIPSLTALENVQLVTEISTNPVPPEECLRVVGLSERMNHFPSQLSGGEQQRVSIARAIVKRPDVLLCDEPTGALDVQTGKLVLEVLARVNRELGTTTAIITHNAAIAAMGDRVIRMHSGQIVEIRANAIKASPSEIEW
jgi:putative ABC transport system ATP-binding protein